MNKVSLFLWCFIFLATSSMPVSAAKFSHEDPSVRYVSDFLVINLKNQVERPFHVVAVVHSENLLKIIEEEGDFVKVETEEGRQGWIAKQYLKSGVPKSTQIEQLNTQLVQLKRNCQISGSGATVPALEEPVLPDDNCQQLQEQLEAAKAELTLLRSENTRLQSVPPSPEQPTQVEPVPQNVPPDCANIADENFELKQALEQANNRYSLLAMEYEKRGQKIAEQENQLAKQSDRSKYVWFGVGALVFCIGMLAGKGGSRKQSKLSF